MAPEAPSPLPSRQRVVVRRVAPWSMARMVAIMSLCLWVVVVVAAVLLWLVASATGLLTNVESFWAQATGQEAVELSGPGLLAAVVIGGLVLVVAATAFWALAVVLVNAIWDLTGGIPLDVQATRVDAPTPERGGPVAEPGGPVAEPGGEVAPAPPSG